jgi:hypothetical protein
MGKKLKQCTLDVHNSGKGLLLGMFFKACPTIIENAHELHILDVNLQIKIVKLLGGVKKCTFY